jgi:hypothetical protein
MTIEILVFGQRTKIKRLHIYYNQHTTTKNKAVRDYTGRIKGISTQ